MFPDVGEVGRLKLEMYRGVKSNAKRLSENFASDPGDYGAGEYWTDNIEFASFYGDVMKKTIELDNVYHIPKEELIRVIEDYRTCKLQDGHELRRKNSLRLTADFKAKGYNALFTQGYECPDIIGLCIF